MKKIISTTNAPGAIGPYSQAIVAGNTVYVSGQLGLDPATGQFAGDTAAEQAVQIFENIKAILEEAGSDMDHIVKTTCFMKNMEDFGSVNEVYAQYLSEGSYPARSAVEVAALPKGGLVEIETIAIVK
ncbi:MAG: RidA family protein [Eubacterium sp.]|nr:RidA family protein [Eubacterium sp.]